LTTQRYVSRVTRAGEGGQSEGFALEANSSAEFSGSIEPCQLTEPGESPAARDRPDNVARSAVALFRSAAAHLRLAGACDLDPACHRQYEVANMQLYYLLQPHYLLDPDYLLLQPYVSMTDAATESCLGEGEALLKEQSSPRRFGVSPRGGAPRSMVFRGPHPAVGKRSAVYHSRRLAGRHLQRHLRGTPYPPGMLEMDCTGLVGRPLRVAPRRRPKREN
jgi:hypothetical protein